MRVRQLADKVLVVPFEALLFGVAVICCLVFKTKHPLDFLTRPGEQGRMEG
jgi:hypothetical protein